jgi:hypothetical protein
MVTVLWRNVCWRRDYYFIKDEECPKATSNWGHLSKDLKAYAGSGNSKLQREWAMLSLFRRSVEFSVDKTQQGRDGGAQPK